MGVAAVRLELSGALWFGLIARVRVFVEGCQVLALRWVWFEELQEVALLVAGSVLARVRVGAAAGVAVGVGVGVGFPAGIGGCR